MFPSFALVAGKPEVVLLAVIGWFSARLTGAAVPPVPVPESATVKVLLVALLATVTLPLAAPFAVGVKVTPAVQEAPAASELPQVLVSAKPLPAVMEEMVAAALPVFWKVTVCAALVEPTFSLPNESEEGEAVSEALAVEEPEPGTPPAPCFASRDAAAAWCRRHVAALSGAIDAAAPCGRPDLAARIAANSMSYVHVDMSVDWLDWLERALSAQGGGAGNICKAWLRHRIGVCHGMWERPVQCVAELEQAVVLHRECGDQLGELRALQNLALGYGLVPNHDKALEYGTLALERYKEYPNPAQLRNFEARAHAGMGDSYLSNMLYPEAIEHYRRALDLFGPGNRDRVLILGSLGDSYRGSGLFAEAVACLEESLSLAAEIGDRFLEADGMHIVGRIYDHFGDRAGAREHWERSLVMFEEIGFAPGVQRVRASLAGPAALEDGRLPTA